MTYFMPITMHNHVRTLQRHVISDLGANVNKRHIEHAYSCEQHFSRALTVWLKGMFTDINQPLVLNNCIQ